MMTIKIAIRNIFRHRTRSIITLSAIAFGCISLIFAGSFFEDAFYQLRESYIKAHTGHLQVYRDGFSEEGRREPFNYLIDNSGEVVSLINTVRGIKFVTARLEFSGLMSTGENTISFIGQGVQPEHEITLRTPIFVSKAELKKQYNDPAAGSTVIENGEPLSEEDTSGIIIGKGLSSTIETKVGDTLTLVTNTVAGSMNALDVSVKGIFFTSAKPFDDHFLRLPLKTAQKLLRTGSVQSLVIMLNKTEDTMKVKKELQDLFKRKKFDLELKTWDELSDFYTKTVILYNKLFLVLKIVIAVIVILSIFNTMNMAALERTKEIGTIMAMGTKRSGVLKLFLSEGLGLGIIGGIIGLISGALFTSIISAIGIYMPPPPGAIIGWFAQPKIVFSVLIFPFYLSLITALISALYPAYKASRLEIAEALRHG